MSWPRLSQTYPPQQPTQHLRDELQPVLPPEHGGQQTAAERRARGRHSTARVVTAPRRGPRPLRLSPSGPHQILLDPSEQGGFLTQ